MRNSFLAILIVIYGLIFSSISKAEDYVFGQGWRSADYYVSGYASVIAMAPAYSPHSLLLDDLSIFAGGNINQWINPFTEIELSQYTLAQQSGEHVSGDVKVERFYNDGIVSDSDTVRVGKMLTPLGDWNLVHAAPLRPIISTPYTAAQGFQGYTSGISWIHEPESDETPGYQLYWAPDNEWFKRPPSETIRNFHNVFGGHINIPLSMLGKLGASFQQGELIETGEMYSLIGGNANQTFGKLMLESEFVTAHFSGQVLPGASARVHDNESGIYGLADYSITEQWHLALESEYYQDHTVALPSRNALLAIAYRPSNSPIVWKLEYINQTGVPASIAPIVTGWQASFATMF